MRVVLLAAANSIHTVQWANRLIARGVDVHVVTIHEPSNELNKAVPVHRLSPGAPVGYVAAYRAARRLFQRLKPDVVNAHYATGYGTLARLAGYRPLLLSVWGSDVYDFPQKTSFHRHLLVSNLRVADALASTSRAMANVTHRYWKPKRTYITPFGVDEKRFAPITDDTDNAPRRSITIGTVKTLSPKYGIDTLLKAFAILYNRLRTETPETAERLRLLIVGGGPDRESLESLARELDIENRTEFRGRVPHEDVPKCLHELDIYVALSRLDSFGVAILEASACELPVVVSDADGPQEVVADGKTGFVVPRDNPEAAAEALRTLVLHAEMRSKMGRSGREHVLANYTWDRCLNIMISAYDELASM